jgi:hypothetical protein
MEETLLKYRGQLLFREIALSRKIGNVAKRTAVTLPYLLIYQSVEAYIGSICFAPCVAGVV